LTKINRFVHAKSAKEKRREIKETDIIIHTWADKKSLGEDGKFNDRYFTVLPEFYKDKGYKVATLVDLFLLNRKPVAYWKALTFLRKNSGQFIIAEDYYSVWDYFWPLRLGLKKNGFRFDNVTIGGVDCSSLFTDQNKLERVPFTAMYYRLFERLAAWGFSPRLVIDGFENMVSDKMIQLGVREFMPGTSLYGFYHMAPPPNILCFYTDIRERGIAPLPDKIICNGDRFKEILVKEHFPEEKLVSGAALRYLYLHKMNKASLPAKDGVFKILLTLPLQREAAIEIFNKTVEAVKNNERYHLLVKPHPLGAPLIMAELGKELPGNAKWLEGSMADAINKCDIVVSAATSAAVDCLMANKEVIRVGRETQLDFDPLAWFKEFGAPVYSVEQLKDRLLYMEKKIKSDSYEIPDHSSMLPELFAPETEENMEVFLPEKMKG